MDQEGVGNTVEKQTMTEKEIVATWSVQNKITSDAVDKLFKEVFSSMQAISVIDMKDLSRTKIPRDNTYVLFCFRREAQQRTITPGNITEVYEPHTLPGPA